MNDHASALFRQKTIGSPASISGVGIHTGKDIQLRLLPAPTNSGIRFRRADCRGVEIPALASHVSSLELATTLGRDDITVSTVEHLMAATQILGIDNLVVELDGPEVPILDGSARPYLLLFQAAGIRLQNATRQILAVTEPVEVRINGKRARISPYPGLRVTYMIDFGDDAIGRQEIDLEISAESFDRELAPARTFALMRDVERMRKAGMALGGGRDNCVVFDDQGAVNTNLRFADEPVRHKALDAIGDLALLGCPVWGHFEAERGGHLMHFKLIEALRDSPRAWTWMRAEPRPREIPFELPVEVPLSALVPAHRSQLVRTAKR